MPKLLPAHPKKPKRPSAETIQFETDRSGTMRIHKATAASEDDADATVETTDGRVEVVEDETGSTDIVVVDEETGSTDIEVVEEETAETDPEMTVAKPEPKRVVPRKAKPRAETDPETAIAKAEPKRIAPSKAKPRVDDLVVKEADTAEYEKEQALLKEKQQREEMLQKARLLQQRQQEEEKLKQAREEKNAERRGRNKAAKDDSPSTTWTQRIAAAAAILVIVYFIGPLAWSYVTARSVPQNEDVELAAEVKLSVDQLSHEFQKDAAAANAKYVDHIVEVTGTVKDFKASADDSTVHRAERPKGGGVGGVQRAQAEEPGPGDPVVPSGPAGHRHAQRKVYRHRRQNH